MHVGNDEEDTDGCILLGMSCSSIIANQHISGSRLAYEANYSIIAKAILSGEKVTITIKDV